MQQPIPALEIQRLYKAFGKKVAVNHISLTIPNGSFFGLVGPNGAGKTTTLSMATGMLRPDKGTVRIFGVDMWSEPEKAKELIGVLPDGMSMTERLTGRETLTYLGLLRGMKPEIVAERSQELLSVLGLLEAEDVLIINYSTGMRKKIALATALLHSPKLLVLDEPFEAVDPVSAMKIRAILEKFVAHGGSVVFSSHVMATVEQLCDSLAVVVDGEIKASGKLDEVRAGKDLEHRFAELVGVGKADKKKLVWLAP